MQLRESGLRGLQQAPSQIQAASDPEQAGASLAEQAARLIAGTVVYDDLFRARSEEVLQQEGVSGVAVPDSPFLADTGLVSAASLSELVRRITQGGEEVRPVSTATRSSASACSPAARSSRRTRRTRIVATEDMSIQVLVRNSGDFQEARRPGQADAPAGSRDPQVAADRPDQQQADEGRDVQQLHEPDFAALTTLKVSVEPVPGEENTGNNTAEYSVIFSLQ